MLQAFTDKLNGIAEPMRLSSTQGREMAPHKKLSEQTGVAVYSQEPLDAIADEINGWPARDTGYGHRWPSTANCS